MSDRIDEYYHDEQERVLQQERAISGLVASGNPGSSGSLGPSPTPTGATTYEQAQREHAERRGMYCLGCGQDLAGQPTGECPRCGRRFDPYDPGTFTIHPPREPTWLEAHDRAPAAAWLVGLYLGGQVLGWLIATYVFAGAWMVMAVYPFWMGVMLWQVMRLVKNDRVDGLIFHVCAGVLAGGVLGVPDGGYAVLVGVIVGAFIGVLREYTDLAELVG